MPSSYPLHKAIEKGNLFSVEKLVKENKEYLNNKDYIGRTPLITAVFRKKHKIAEFLLSQGANPSDYNGIPLLHSVVSGGDAVDILKIFLKYHQVDPNVLDKLGNVPINYTVGRLNFKWTFLLLTFPTIKVDIEDRFGKNPLEHLLIRFESASNAEQERLKKDYTKCIRAFLLKGAIVRKSILCKYLPNEKYEEIQKLIHSIMESIQEKFKLPEDIKSTQILLQLDSWQWALLWSTAISRGNPKRKPFFGKLPTELVQMVIEAALDYRLTQAQIAKIFEKANFPCKETPPDCEPKGSRRSARRFLHIENAPEPKKQAPEATASTFSIRNRP
jgi:hypothetical protein